MVRTTIACAFCRRSKTKCVHDGKPPCRSCFKSKRAECILSGPFETEPSSSTAKPRESDLPSPRRRRNARRNLNAGTVSHDIGVNGTAVGKLTKDIILGLSPRIILVAATTCRQKFPELGFLHLPKFFSRSTEDDTVWIKIAATVALCHRFLPVTIKDQLPTEDELAAYSREGLQTIQSVSPSIAAVQALLIMSMHEWGAGNGYGAWTHSGMATRMMQFLDARRHDQVGEAVDKEIHNRTFWACFFMDRFIFCGKSQPLALPLDKMTIDLPMGEEDFAFGGISHDESSLEPAGRYTVDTFYTALIMGFEIWSKILDLIISGGRRKPGMSTPENCPWMEGSPWKTLLDSVEKWRSQHTDRLKFPTTDVAVHVSLGHGEKFAYVNLLYYVCILFLNREYIPFLPIHLSEPVGPIDPPLLEATAPPGWWHDRAKDLFNAAEYITLIHQQLDELNAPLLTPFAAFCSFCAGSMNGYVTSFPHMNLNRSPNSAKYEELNFAYLENFTGLWKMGIGWVQTLKRVQDLRLHVTRDRARFIGKTRSDFAALDESIHDYAGVTPPARTEAEPPETSSALPNAGNGENGHIAVENSQGTPQYPEQFSSASAAMANDFNVDGFLTDDQNWDWPMWGDQQFPPFDVGDMQFGDNPDATLDNIIFDSSELPT